MRSLAFLQFFSFLSRIGAMFVGILQSLLIVNILTTEEYGLVGLVLSIAGMVGIAQHLGLASSSTKEISSAKNHTEIFHVVLASLSIRFLISFPIALFLIFFSEMIASQYQNNSLNIPLKIFGFILLIQAFQSIFNSVIAGTQRFKILFTYQLLITFISVLIFIPLVFQFRSLGYFYALLTLNIIQTFILGFLAFKDLDFKISLPSKSDYKKLLKDLLKVSLAIYIVKILFTIWQELPVVLLSQKFPLETIALFAFAFNFSSKLMTISDSITDVNLPVFSKKSSESLEDFFEQFKKNFNIVFPLIFFVGISISFWARDILIVSDYLVFFISNILNLGLSMNIFEKYSPSLFLFLPLLISMIFYSYLNIFKSSIFVPLNLLKEMLLAFGILLFVSFGLYFSSTLDLLFSMSVSLAIGALFSFIYSIFLVYKKYNIVLINTKNALFSLVTFIIGLFSLFDLNLFVKLVIFLVYFYVLYSIFRINIYTIIIKRLRK